MAGGSLRSASKGPPGESLMRKKVIETTQKRTTRRLRKRWKMRRSMDKYSANGPNISLSFKFKFKLIFDQFVTRRRKKIATKEHKETQRTRTQKRIFIKIL